MPLEVPFGAAGKPVLSLGVCVSDGTETDPRTLICEASSASQSREILKSSIGQAFLAAAETVDLKSARSTAFLIDVHNKEHEPIFPRAWSRRRFVD